MSDHIAVFADLAEAVRRTQRDFASMPFFVRPMVQKGFARRCGMGIDDWRKLADELRERAGAGDSVAEILDTYRALSDKLERLAENYASAPSRAAKGMGRIPAVLERIRRESAARERAVRAVIEVVESR